MGAAIRVLEDKAALAGLLVPFPVPDEVEDVALVTVVELLLECAQRRVLEPLERDLAGLDQGGEPLLEQPLFLLDVEHRQRRVLRPADHPENMQRRLHLQRRRRILEFDEAHDRALDVLGQEPRAVVQELPRDAGQFGRSAQGNPQPQALVGRAGVTSRGCVDLAHARVLQERFEQAGAELCGGLEAARAAADAAAPRVDRQPEPREIQIIRRQKLAVSARFGRRLGLDVVGFTPSGGQADLEFVVLGERPSHGQLHFALAGPLEVDPEVRLGTRLGDDDPGVGRELDRELDLDLARRVRQPAQLVEHRARRRPEPGQNLLERLGHRRQREPTTAAAAHHGAMVHLVDLDENGPAFRQRHFDYLTGHPCAIRLPL